MTLYLADHGRIGDLHNTEFPIVFTVNSAADMKTAMNNDMLMSKLTDNSRRARPDGTPWEESDCLYGDIDGGMSIKEFKDRFGGYEFYLATSKSHQKGKSGKPPADCFHVFFPIATTDDQETYAKLLRILSAQDGFDHGVKDLPRMFSGNPESIVAHHPGIPVTDYLYQLWGRYDDHVIESHHSGDGKGRNNTLYSIGCALVGENKGVHDITRELVRKNAELPVPLAPSEMSATIANVMKYGAPKEVTKALKTPEAIPNIIGITSEARDYVDSLMYTGKRFMQEEFTPVDTYLASMITAGFTIVAGAPKCGKSWLSLEWGIALANGEPWNGYECMKSKVLILALEDMGYRLQERFELLGIAELPDNLVIMLDDRILRQDDKLDLLDDMIKRHKFDVVFVDTLAKYMGTPAGSGTLYNNEYELYSKLGDVARDNCIAIVSYTHTNQQNYATGDMKKISGSNGLPGATDNYIVIDSNGMTVEGRGLPHDVIPLVFNQDKERPRWEQIGERQQRELTPSQFRALECRDAVGDVVSNRPDSEFSFADIEKMVGGKYENAFTHTEIKNAISRLRQGNNIILDNKGPKSKYRWAKPTEIDRTRPGSI